MTIGECINRQQKYEEIAERLLNRDNIQFTDEELDLIQLSVLRSIAIEQLNVAELKNKKGD